MRYIHVVIIALWIQPGWWVGAIAQSSPQQVQTPSATPAQPSTDPKAKQEPPDTKSSDHPRQPAIDEAEHATPSYFSLFWNGLSAFLGMLVGSWVGHWFTLHQYRVAAADTSRFELQMELWKLYFKMSEKDGSPAELLQNEIGPMNALAERFRKTLKGRAKDDFTKAYFKLFGISNIFDLPDTFWLYDQDTHESIRERIKNVLAILP